MQLSELVIKHMIIEKILIGLLIKFFKEEVLFLVLLLEETRKQKKH